MSLWAAKFMNAVSPAEQPQLVPKMQFHSPPEVWVTTAKRLAPKAVQLSAWGAPALFAAAWMAWPAADEYERYFLTRGLVGKPREE